MMNTISMSKRIRNTLIFIFILMISFSAFASDDGSEVLGVWQGDNQKERFEIYKKGDQYYGKIIWTSYNDLNGHGLIDYKNPDINRRDQSIIGLEILMNFSYKGDGVYSSGKVYDPGSGNTYKCRIIVEGDMAKVRGYIFIPLIGRTETAYRIK